MNKVQILVFGVDYDPTWGEKLLQVCKDMAGFLAAVGKLGMTPEQHMALADLALRFAASRKIVIFRAIAEDWDLERLTKELVG